MKKLSVIVAVFSIVALTALAYGEMGGHSMKSEMMEAEHHMSEHVMALNLDEQQKASIGEIKSKMKKETIRSTADLCIAQIELKDLLCKDPVDMKAVEAKVKQTEMMRTGMQLSCIKAMEDIKMKLTSDQRKKLKEMMDAGPMMEEMGKKHDSKGGMKGK